MAILPWTLQSLLNELYTNSAPLPVPRRAVEPIITSMLSSPKTSLRLSEKTLQKTPSCLVKLLKACALHLLKKPQEARAMVLAVVKDGKGLGEAGSLLLLSPLCSMLGLTGCLAEAADAAMASHPDRKDVCLAVLSLYLRESQFKKVQQLSLRMYKSFKSPTDPSKQDPRWLQAAVQAMLVQASEIKDKSSPERSLLINLVERSLQSLPEPSSVDDYHLRLQLCSIKGPQELLAWFHKDEVEQLATKDLGMELQRREVIAEHGTAEAKTDLVKHCLENMHDKNWATISLAVSLSMKLENQQLLNSVVERLEQLSNDSQLGRERGYALGLILPHKLQASDSLAPSLQLKSDSLQLIVNFYQGFSSKYSTWSDLEGFLSILKPDQYDMLAEKLQPDADKASVYALQTRINKERILLSFRHIHKLSDASVDWAAEANRHVEAYFEALPLGKDLALTDLQYADEYALMACESWLHLWHKIGDSAHLLSCAALLDFAIKRSPYRYQIRILLLRVYRLLGLPLRALEQFQGVGAKQIQNDTLAHYIADRASTWAVCATKKDKGAAQASLPLLEQLGKMDNWYDFGLQETAESIGKAWRKAVWQKSGEYHEFYRRLSQSMTRSQLLLESLRSGQALGATEDGASSLLQKLQRSEEMNLYDNRDMSLLPLSVRGLSSLGPDISLGWLKSMIATTTTASKLLDPSATPESLSAGAQALDSNGLFTTAEIEWQRFVEACKQVRFSNAEDAVSQHPALSNLFAHRLQEVESVSKSNSWTWEPLHSAAIALEAWTFFKAFLDTVTKSKSLNPTALKELKKLASDGVRPALSSLAKQLTSLPNKVVKPKGKGPFADRPEITWTPFYDAAHAEWKAACADMATAIKQKL